MINKLFSTVTGTVSLDIREPGSITAIMISAQVPTAVTAEIEVSFNSTAQFQTNDATGILASVNLPAVIGAQANVVLQLSEPVDAGERIYLHISGSPRTSATIVTSTTGSPGRVPARRR